MAKTATERRRDAHEAFAAVADMIREMDLMARRRQIAAEMTAIEAELEALAGEGAIPRGRRATSGRRSESREGKVQGEVNDGPDRR